MALGKICKASRAGAYKLACGRSRSWGDEETGRRFLAVGAKAHGVKSQVPLRRLVTWSCCLAKGGWAGGSNPRGREECQAEGLILILEAAGDPEGRDLECLLSSLGCTGEDGGQG